MKTNELLNREDVINTIIATIDELMDAEVDQLSNNDLALLKNVSLSSISAMKKKNYTNAEILTTTKNSNKSNTTTIKSAIASLTDDELFAQFGLRRV